MKNVFIYQTPIGSVGIAENGRAITDLFFGAEKRGASDYLRQTDLLREAAGQLREYLEGNRTVFRLPLDPAGTPFQLAVWRALVEIPYGETRSYTQIAAAVGRPAACRAVGMANNRNPIAILIPCHRVIGADGSLTGYAGGLAMKKHLLALEGAHVLYPGV